MEHTKRIFLSHYNLKISRPEVKKNLTNFPKKFCKFRPQCSWSGANLINLLGAYLGA